MAKKKCPTCGNEWDESYNSCPTDGTVLSTGRKVLHISASQQPDYSSSAPQAHAHSQTGYGGSQSVTAVNPNSTIGSQVAPTTHQVLAKKNQNFIEGSVRNFNEDSIRTNVVKQWFLSLIKGCDFVRDGQICTFNVQETNNEVHSVILYGKMIRGRFQDHHRVRVYGSHDRSNTIVSNHIENLSSKSTVTVNKSLSSLSVRLITIVSLLCLVYLVFFVDYLGLFTSIISGVTSFFLTILSAILPLIIIIFILWLLIKKFFK